jgi:hypothetical protein
MMTEEEAKGKWCPHVRVARLETLGRNDFIVGGTNRDALGRVAMPASCLCLASACMAWRWALGVAEDASGNEYSAPSTTRGYCGLAGKP